MRSLIAYLLFYPTLWYNQILCRIFSWRNWWDRIDEHLIIGALPMKRHVKPLHDEGIRAVVNTCNEYSGLLEHYNEHGIDQLRVPTVDFTPPSLEHVQQAVKYINEQISDGNGVYVHCKAGRGRSATVVMCWLLDNTDMSPAEAQQHMQQIRPHVLKTVYQRDVVQEFYKTKQSQ